MDHIRSCFAKIHSEDQIIPIFAFISATSSSILSNISVIYYFRSCRMPLLTVKVSSCLSIIISCFPSDLIPSVTIFDSWVAEKLRENESIGRISPSSFLYRYTGNFSINGKIFGCKIDEVTDLSFITSNKNLQQEPPIPACHLLICFLH